MHVYIRSVMIAGSVNGKAGALSKSNKLENKELDSGQIECTS